MLAVQLWRLQQITPIYWSI